MKTYYLLDGETQLEPFSLKELKAQSITPNSKVWCQDEKDWIRAADLKELRSFFPSSILSENPQVLPKLSNKEDAYRIESAQTENIVNNQSAEFAGSSRGNSFRSDNVDLPMQSAISPKLVAFSLGLAIVIILSLINFSGGTTSVSTTGALIMAEDEPEKTGYKKSGAASDASASNKTGSTGKGNESSLEQKNKTFRRNWSGYINHSASKYKLRPLGGITGLIIYVNNKSDRIIDEVVVKVTYYKNDGTIFETKDIRFNNIQPNSQDEAKVPNTQRGTKITSEISRVTSRSYQFCYNNASSGSKSQADPWYCK
jgi:hypothetical protein